MDNSNSILIRLSVGIWDHGRLPTKTAKRGRKGGDTETTEITSKNDSCKHPSDVSSLTPSVNSDLLCDTLSPAFKADSLLV